MEYDKVKFDKDEIFYIRQRLEFNEYLEHTPQGANIRKTLQAESKRLIEKIILHIPTWRLL